MTKWNAYTLTRVAVVAALYVVLTFVCAPLAFREVQFRFSEVLLLLCFYDRRYCWSLVIGCALANLFFSPFGLIDVVVGTFATLLTVLAISRCKRLLTASLFATLFCLIISLEIFLLAGAPYLLPVFLGITATVLAGEFIVVTVIGVPLFKLLERNQGFMRLIAPGRAPRQA